MRKVKGHVTRLEEKTRMRFVEIIQEVAKVDLRIHKRQVHVGRGTLLIKLEYLDG